MAETIITCPRCRLALDSYNWKNLTLDKCRKCEGHWFDESELTLTVEVLRPIKDWSTGKPSALPCVRCAGGSLTEIDFPGTAVAILACEGCRGTWLDKGKVDALREALRPIVGEAGKSPLGDRAAEIVAEYESVVRDTLCPHCRGKLEAWPRKSFVLERCEACNGYWFDSGELTAELGISRKLPPLKEGRATELPCPHCPGKKLVVVKYPRTTVDLEVCPDCRGNWLDEPGLARLRNEIRPSGEYPVVG